MGTGIPTQVLKQAEEAEKVYQDQIDSLMPPTGATGDIGATGEVSEEIKAAMILEEETPDERIAKAQHKYEVLQGKYNKEVPELSQRLAEQAGVIRVLQEQVMALAGGKKSVDEKGHIDKGILDSLEQDPNIGYLKTEYPEVWKALEVVMTKSAEDAAKKIEKLSIEIADQKKKTEKNSRDMFYDEIDKIDDWDVINKSDGFNEWLDEKEPLTGFPRRDILNDAYASLDHARVKNFFVEFKAKTVKPDKKDEDIIAGEKKIDLGIAPRTTGTKAKKDLGDTKTNFIKASEISSFYTAVRKGLYKGREEERAKREAELDKAISENRVLVGQ